MTDTPQIVYNNFGIKIPTPFDLNPPSNLGLVYQTANDPTKSASLLPGQTIADLTFVSGYSQRRIRITMNPADTPPQTAGSIAIIDENNVIIASLGVTGGAGTNLQGGVLYLNPQTNNNAINVFGTLPNATNALVNILQLQSNSTAVPLVLGQNGAVTPPFYLVQQIKGPTRTISFYISDDGSDPNGLLTGQLGDICYGVGGGIPSYCAVNNSTVWIPF